ncbi:MAG: guanylate kinase [Chitinophagales bacterium]|jgi:guanylate kinase|nr:guanylate kinase [Chitinophagales bacterium]
MKHIKLLLITAPSGSGKTSLIKRLLEEYPQFSFSTSATTRQMRPGEVSEKDYYYLSETEFDQKVKENAFLEWEEVYQGTKYGTLKSEIDRINGLQKIPILDIDVMGAMRVKKMLHDELLSIYIMPPNLEALESRLRKRNTETEEKIQIRLNKAKCELKFADLFDLKVINDDFEVAYHDFLGKIITHFPKLRN